MVDVHEKARKDAEKFGTEMQASKEDAVKDKDKELRRLPEKKNQELQAAVDQRDQEMAQFKDSSKKRTDELEKINVDLRMEKALVEKPTFEVPSGSVQLVDMDTKLVWINRGEADALHPGTTFRRLQEN